MQPVPKPAKIRRKKKRKALSAHAKFKKECDRLWSLIVRSKNLTCVWCRKRAAVHAHHIISRKYLPTRHVIENGVALCGGCHMMAHNRPDHFIPFIKNLLGDNAYESLRRSADLRISKQDYAITLIGLNEILNEINKDSYKVGGKG